MLTKLINALASYKADRDVRRGLALVRDEWEVYRARNQKPAESEIVQYVGPFIAPTVALLSTDAVWSDKPLSAKTDLIFVVLLADVETSTGREKLLAMRELLATDN